MHSCLFLWVWFWFWFWVTSIPFSFPCFHFRMEEARQGKMENGEWRRKRSDHDLHSTFYIFCHGIAWFGKGFSSPSISILFHTCYIFCVFCILFSCIYAQCELYLFNEPNNQQPYTARNLTSDFHKSKSKIHLKKKATATATKPLAFLYNFLYCTQFIYLPVKRKLHYRFSCILSIF